jgi:hypothetical protein
MEKVDRVKIEKEAWEVLVKFSKALEKVKVSERKVEGEGSGVRKEKEGNGKNVGNIRDSKESDFRKRMFANAPEKDGDCIVAEKGKW